MQALMLAAGLGRRLGKYTENATKCMVPVNNKTLIEHAIEALIDNGIKKLTMVVGYKKEVLKTFLKEKYSEIQIEYIDNPIYDISNNIYSLYLAKDVLAEDDTILLESDLIFNKEIIGDIISSKDKNLAVVSPFENWMDGTVALINKKNEITGLLGKADFQWENRKSYYKTVNIYKFSKEFSQNIYMPFLEAYQKAYGKNEYYETVLKVISYLNNGSLKAHVVDGNQWYEIDDPQDLAIAEARFAKGKRHLELLQNSYGGYWRYPSMIDFCYLVNPYYPPKQLVNEMKASFDVLMADYPSGDKQQSLLAGKIFSLDPSHIAVGNGAAELIAAVSDQGFLNGKVVVPYPTFNEYPERFGNNNVVWLQTNKETFSYEIKDVLDLAKYNSVGAVLLINPENPSGHCFTEEEVNTLATELQKLNKTLILDESFIDFAEKEMRFTFLNEELLQKYSNLIVIKSISKSYGIPGFRLGVLASSNKEMITKIQKKTSIWNINSFGEYFLQIFEKYKSAYAVGCDKIAEERKRFSTELSKIKGIKVYPSQANYILCKLDCNITAEELTIKLLDNYNLFIKDLSSKKGFDHGQFIRLAVRNTEDNNKLLETLKEIIK